MTDESQHTTAESGATDRPTDNVQTEPETTDGDERHDTVEQRVEDHQAVLDGLQEHLGDDGDGRESSSERTTRGRSECGSGVSSDRFEC